MLVAAAMLLGTAWMGDDAFITLRVIDNFVNGYGLRYNVLERVQVFTHPLWLMFLTPFYALTREPLVTTMLASVAVSLGALWLLAARIAKDIVFGCLLVLLAVASTAIYQFSTSGLETPLTFLLLALLVWQLQQVQKMWIPAGIIGLLLLNRLDLAVLVGPAAMHLFFRAKGQRIRVALAIALPALAWMVFSVVYYGAPFPNTAYAKLGTGYGTGELVSHGLAYTQDFALHDPLLALVIGKAVFDAARSSDWTTRLSGLGMVLYLAYTIVIGGDFMSGRFFAAPGFLAFCLIACQPAPQWLMNRAKMVAPVLFVVVGALLASRLIAHEVSVLPGSGIRDERNFYYADLGLVPVLHRWVSTGTEPVPVLGVRGEELKAIAQRAGDYYAVAVLSAGLLGYYGGPMVHIVDMLALTDPFLARLPAIAGSRVGHYRRKIPAFYTETVTEANPATNIAALRPLLNDITLAVRAPLFAAGRWQAIWRLASGQYAWVYDSDLDGIR
ncbi:MAG: hypothetical protein WB870_11815 [Gallionellaceae bacterium]